MTALFLLVACAPAAGSTAGAPEPKPTGTPLPPAELPLTLETSGGFAGLSRTLAVDTSGRWTFTDRRSDSAPDTGRLTDDQLAELRRLLADPELKRVPWDKGRGCADFIRYTLVTQARTVRNGPCGEASAAFTTLIGYLSEHTAM